MMLKLAKLASMNQLPTVHMPPPQQRQKRRLVHHRRSLVQRRTASKKPDPIDLQSAGTCAAAWHQVLDQGGHRTDPAGSEEDNRVAKWMTCGVAGWILNCWSWQ